MPNKEQLDKFWTDLQKTLNQANADINLDNSADIFRIRMFEFENKNPVSFDTDARALYPFCEHPDVDLKTVTDEQLIAMQRPGKPDYNRLAEMYLAAREGRLFFDSLVERGMQSRQIVCDKNGNMSAMDDISHGTKEVQIAAENLNFIEPPKPKYLTVNFGTKFKAFFGSKAAKSKIQRIERANEAKRNNYEKQMREWEQAKKMDSDFLTQVWNGQYAVNGYLVRPNDEDAEREIRLRQLGTQAHYRPDVDNLVTATGMLAGAAAKELSSMIQKNPIVTPEAQELLAEIFYQKSLAAHAVSMFNDCTLTSADISLTARQAIKGSPERDANYNLICGSERFRQAIGHLKFADYEAFIEAPEAAIDTFYKKCAFLMKDTPVAVNHPQLEQVKVKEPAKEAPASDQSAFSL